MSTWIVSYLRPLLAVSFLVAALRVAFPERSGTGMIRFASGLLILLVALRPIADIRAEDFAKALAKQEMNTLESKVPLSVDNDSIISAIIKEKTEAYISDKAAQLNIPLHSVSVLMEKGGSYPYPAAVTISGYYTQQQRTELTKWIETNLAIPAGKQTWETG